MNAGFEDCTVLAELMDEYDDNWGMILKMYNSKRKPNGDAVARLALLNFVEMRDKVADPLFLERKKIEKELGKIFPEKFTSIYEMVTFSHTPYSTTISCIEAQDELLDKIMSKGDFFDNISKNEFKYQLQDWINQYHQTVQKFDFNR